MSNPPTINLADEKFSLGEASKRRNYFEHDVIFVDYGLKSSTVLAAYESACYMAEISARYAVSGGTLVDLRKAQWYEALTKAFECVLMSCQRLDGEGFSEEIEFDETDLPDPPSF